MQFQKKCIELSFHITQNERAIYRLIPNSNCLIHFNGYISKMAANIMETFIPFNQQWRIV